MFVHLGGETVVDAREVVVILDARQVRTAEAGVAPPRARTRHREAPPRALVVTTMAVYPAPVTPATVARRIMRLGKMPNTKTAET